jgi:hypothetical protein
MGCQRGSLLVAQGNNWVGWLVNGQEFGWGAAPAHFSSALVPGRSKSDYACRYERPVESCLRAEVSNSARGEMWAIQF